MLLISAKIPRCPCTKLTVPRPVAIIKHVSALDLTLLSIDQRRIAQGVEIVQGLLIPFLPDLRRFLLIGESRHIVNRLLQRVIAGILSSIQSMLDVPSDARNGDFCSGCDGPILLIATTVTG